MAFRFGEMIDTLDAQVRRGHYRFAFSEKRVVGYAGYALYDAADAEAFAAGGAPPPDERANGKDVVWLLCLAGVNAVATRALLSSLSRDYAGLTAMGVRYRANGQRTVQRVPIHPRLFGLSREPPGET